MAHLDLIVAGGRAVLPGQGLSDVDIGIIDGRIAAIAAPGHAGTAATTLNACGLVVMPAALDVHLHLGHGNDIARPRVPGDANRETAAAARGGIATMIPYLMASEPFESIIADVVAVTTAGARIDFGYHFIISTPEQLAGVPRYIAEHGVPTFKFFMNNRGGEGKRLGLPDIDDGAFFKLFELAAKHGGMVCPHPENIEIAWVLRDRTMQADPEGKGGLASWNATRPAFVEGEAVQRAGYLARITKAPVYIVHTSSSEALEAAKAQRAAGAKVWVETCPHYLTHDITWEGGVIAKINPPLREAADREALWAGLVSGAIDTVATDHVHRGIQAKAGNIWQASPGCPGMETMLPVLLSEGHHKRGLSLARISELVAGKPARAMGLAHRKGAIAAGLDADLAIIDIAGETRVDNATVASSAGYSIYDGWRLKGRIVHTLVRGRSVLRDGVLDDSAVGTGQFLRRTLS
ncbi:MAG: dihydroorotase [Hyphomicrobiaceae bacterium]